MRDGSWFEKGETVVRRRQKSYFIFLRTPTVNCGELLSYFSQLDEQEGRITYPSNNKSITVEATGNSFAVAT
jgi:hypothetical protein